jgi:hypothetical protein
MCAVTRKRCPSTATAVQVNVAPFFASTPLGQLADRAGGSNQDRTKSSAFFSSIVVLPQPASATTARRRSGSRRSGPPSARRRVRAGRAPDA